MALIFALSLLAACGGGGGGNSAGGGGGGADTVTLSLLPGGTVVYTETTSLATLNGYDPMIDAYYHVGSSRTFLSLYSGWTGSFLTGSYNGVLDIHFSGSSAGVYSVTTGSATVNYTRTTPLLNVVSNSGSVTVTSYDSVGGHVQGTFLASNGTYTLSGSFSATREADQ